MKKIMLCFCSVFLIAGDMRGSDQRGRIDFPEELVAEANQRGLKPLMDLSGIQGEPEGPTYVYGLFSGKKKNSAVFWAYKDVIKDSEVERKYFLVVFCKTPKCSKCPDIIEYWNPPAGLSIVARAPLNLDHFDDIDGEATLLEQYPPKNNFIRTGDDSLDIWIHCYQGKWYSAMRD